MKSKLLIEKQLRKKTNPELVETIIACKKKDAWLKVGGYLSGSKRNRAKVNLEKIEREAEEGKTIVVPGKVLSDGNLTKKIKIVALDFSKNTEEKLLSLKINFNTLLEEIKSNPDAKGIQILK